jgi:hypothetical protein
MWYKYMYILYCITMYYIWYHVFPLAFLPPSGDGPKYLWYATRTSQENPWIRWCLCGHKFCHVPPRKGVPITIFSMIFHDFSTHFLFWWNGLPGYSKKTTAKFICTLRQSQRSATWVVFGMPVSSSTLGMCEWVYSVCFYIWICIHLCVWILCEAYNYLYLWLLVYTIHACMQVRK